MLYSRLKLAHNLLTEDGVIFISIDDYEFDNIKKMCNEIFGEDNFINNRTFIWHITDGTNKGFIARAHEYIIGYAKNIDKLKPFVRPEKMGSESIKHLTNAPGPKNKISQILFPKGLRYEGDDAIIEGIVGGDKEPIKVIGKMIFKDGYLVEDAILESSWRNKKQIETFFSGLPAIDEKGQEIVEVFMKRNGKPMYRKELSYFSPKSVQNFRHSSYENKLRSELFFSNPKPVEMVAFLAGLFEDKDSIILDFYSGSATTAQSVMQLNAEDGGNRKFILVQIPEETFENSDSFKAGYKNICEIGKERIRRAGEKIKVEIEENNAQIKIGEESRKVPDIGFRVLKVDSTNMKDVYYAANEYTQSMIDGLESNIKEDRDDLDLLYGVLLDRGLPLSLNHKIEEVDGVTIHIVDENSLIACFAEKISENIVREIAKRQPLRVVFRDSSFENSPDKINVEEIFKLMAPNTSVKVI